MNGRLDWMVLNISEVFVGLKCMTGGPIWMLVACLAVAKDIMNPRLLKVLRRPHSLNYYLIIHTRVVQALWEGCQWRMSEDRKQSHLALGINLSFYWFGSALASQQS